MRYLCRHDECDFSTSIQNIYCCGACGQADAMNAKIGDPAHLDHSPNCNRMVFVPEPEQVIEQETTEVVPDDLTGGLTETELEAGYAIQVRIVHLETNVIVGEAVSRGVRPDLFVRPPGDLSEGYNAFESVVTKVGAEAYGKAFASPE